jgi:glycosyltransferase involved in cell wall biosynthesis
MRDNLQLDYQVPDKRVRVIHNFTYEPQQNTDKRDPLFLAAGRVWDQAKNLRMLTELRSSLDWELRIADGMLPHSDLMAEMARASVFVHPALYEPFGLSVLEAARSGCCLLLANIPSLRELWDGAAVFADPRNPRDWTYQMNRLAGNSEERSRLSRLAQIRSQQYTEENAIQQYWELYHELMNATDIERKESAA